MPPKKLEPSQLLDGVGSGAGLGETVDVIGPGVVGAGGLVVVEGFEVVVLGFKVVGAKVVVEVVVTLGVMVVEVVVTLGAVVVLVVVVVGIAVVGSGTPAVITFVGG